MSEVQQNIGKILNGAEPRDAIHIAVYSVRAGEKLWAGDRIGIKNGKAFKRDVKPIGIVDPYLIIPAQEGDWFYLFLFPNTITSLRHNWSHPDLDNQEDRKNYEYSSVTDSKVWLQNFADEWGMDYDEMINSADSGYGITARGNSEIHSWGELEDGGAEFWHHLEIVTGKKYSVTHREDTYFSCSC